MEIVKLLLNAVEVFFLCYMAGYSTYLFLSVVAGSGALYQENKRLRLKNELNQDYDVPVTIIVPAYNEEVTVVDTIKSLLELEYSLYEIVVVNDGSKDHTEQELIRAFQMTRVKRPIYRRIPCEREQAVFEAVMGTVRLTLVTKKGGGKADALNMGINVSHFPYFICMDADSVLQKDSLYRITRPLLEHDNTVAVGGLVRISNYARLLEGRLVSYHMPFNPLVGMQIMEYDRSFLASRLLLDRFNGNLIISGAFGLFQKELAALTGGYDRNTLGEDMELVIKLHLFCRLHQIDYRIVYAPNAVCWSQAPGNLKDLKQQRKRWYLGLFQCMNKYRQLFFNYKLGFVSLVSYFYYLIYELLSPFIEVFGLCAVVAAGFLGLVDVQDMVLLFGIYAGFGGLLTLTAFFARIYTMHISLTALDVIKALIMCLGEALIFRFVLAFVRLTAFFGYRKKKNHWGKINRSKINISS